MDADPDIMTFAKGIASGFPFAGIATKPNHFEGLKTGSIGGTYSANTLGCAAACATIDAIIEDEMLENATQRGKQLVEVRSSFSRPWTIFSFQSMGVDDWVLSISCEPEQSFLFSSFTQGLERLLRMLTKEDQESI